MPTLFKQVKNNAKSRAVSGQLNNVTSPVTFSVTGGQGSRFPQPGNGFYVTVWDATTYPSDPFDDPNMEIMLVTARATDSMTATRAQLNTVASAHAGTPAVQLLIVDQHINDVTTSLNNLETIVLTTSGSVLSVSGTQNEYNKTLYRPIFRGFYDTPATYSGTGTVTIDLALSNEHRVQIGAGNITLAFNNAQIGQKFIINLTQDGTGSRTVTWPGTVKWAGGTAPTITTTAAKTDIFGFLVQSASQFNGCIVSQNT